MKIGAFARYFNVTVETVRYYMELGLLIPEKKETQYRFHSNCQDDMKTILELKELRFSLLEIQKILSFQRISQMADEEDRDYLTALLLEKKLALMNESAKINRSIHLIEDKIRATSSLSLESSKTGVPLACIPLLACPLCERPLPVANAFLQEQHVWEAGLQCRCGYQAEIKDGILITSSETVSEKQDYFIYDQDVFPQLSPSWISLMEKGSQWIYNTMLKDLPSYQIILQPNVDVYVFPPKYLSSLPAGDKLYVFSANSHMMLKKLKGKLEHLNPRLNVLYLVNNDQRLPLRKKTIDLVIDTLSFNDFSLYSQTYPLSRLLPYLKPAAKILGTYMYYEAPAKSLLNARAMYPEGHPQNFQHDYIANQLNANGFRLAYEEYIGNTPSPGVYLDYHLDNERIHVASYQAESG